MELLQQSWDQLNSDKDDAAKVQVLMTKLEEEKLHSMLNEKFWGADVDEDSGLVYCPFTDAFSCLAL
jgi:hypothetical protein